jgi:asparagine synthase (glutamine-hydrolysing)
VSILNNQVKLNITGLRQYKKLRTFFNGNTIYEDIKMFPAGHFMENKKIQKYWELPLGPQNPPENDELKDLIFSAVEYRKVADVSIGSYLSGGLDSTIIAALTKELHTWTIGFEDTNEFQWARIAAEKIGSNHHEIITTPEEFIKDAKQMIDVQKEPISVPNEVLLYEMTKSVKKENTVILSGEGADELFFGYDRIFKWANTCDTLDLRLFSKFYSYGSEEDIEIVEDAISPFYKYGKPIYIIAAFFQIAHLHGLLRRLDTATMMCAVEARTLFVDYRIIDRMAGVPFEYSLENGLIKAPLKKLFKDIVPSEILAREKVGFPVDLRTIFNTSSLHGFDTWTDFNIKNLPLLGVS